MQTAKIIDFAPHHKEHKVEQGKDILDEAAALMDSMSRDEQASIACLFKVVFEMQFLIKSGIIEGDIKDVGGIDMYTSFMELLKKLGKEIVDIKKPKVPEVVGA